VTEQPQALVFLNEIVRPLDMIMACLESVDEAGRSWRPSAPNTNSLYTIAIHTMGNAEENAIWMMSGNLVKRDREAEFTVADPTLAGVQQRWQDLRGRLLDMAPRISDADIDRVIPHPRRGTITGREVLLIAIRHSCEHLGEAQLTRDLYLAQ
jgi:hypothetical protein